MNLSLFFDSIKFLEQLNDHQLLNIADEFTYILILASNLLGCNAVSVD
jgi:hypothetical protein